jgi:hypothetical protein
MIENADAITHGESELLHAESERARGRDRQLASELDRPRPGGETSSAGYLRELSDRPRRPAGTEHRLVVAHARSSWRRSCR